MTTGTVVMVTGTNVTQNGAFREAEITHCRAVPSSLAAGGCDSRENIVFQKM